MILFPLKEHLLLIRRQKFNENFPPSLTSADIPSLGHVRFLGHDIS